MKIGQALQQYVQDTGHYPGNDWVIDLKPYLSSIDVFACPLAQAMLHHGNVTYGYNMMFLDYYHGKGISAYDVSYPNMVMIFCDTCSYENFPKSIILGFGETDINRMNHLLPKISYPMPIHNGKNRLVVGDQIVEAFCDGHVETEIQKRRVALDEDISSKIFHSCCKATIWGLLENPVATLQDFTANHSKPFPLLIGGEPCSAPILKLAAAGWKAKVRASYTEAFNGQYVTTPTDANIVWGCADGNKPQGHSCFIGQDAMILIVARNTKIPLLTQKRKESDTYVVDESEIRQLIGNATSECHPYTYNRFSGSRAFLTRSFNSPGWQGISRDAIPIRDDREMVKKIAADAYGIGYCSAAFYDPELVTSLGLRVKNVTRFFPPSLTIDHKRIDRILYPAGLGADAWPLLRNLYVVCSGHAWDVTGGGMAFGNVMFSPQGNGQQALRYSYLYCGNYFCY